MAGKPNPTDDARLAQALAAGERAAFEALYEQYGQRMYLYALRRVGNEQLAQDLLQDSLLAAWEGAQRFRGEGRLIAWLLKIVHNKSLQALAKERKTDPDEISEELAGAELTEVQASQREQQGALATGLAQLSVEHRSVLELVFYQGLSLQEVAEVCNCPLGTVKSRLAYAKQALQGELVRAGMRAEDVR